jgi:peroxiredoxin/glutaredoxin
MKLNIGDPAPNFTLKSHLDTTITLSSLRGKNVIIAFFPLAFTPIWSGQIPSYEAEKAKFAGLNAQVLGISVDHIPCLQAWAESLGGISFPLLSDFWPHGEISQKYGVLREDGTSERALFIIDRYGVLRYIDIHDIDDQPYNEDLRIALREIDPEAAAREPKPAPLAPLPHGGVVMYCTPWCPDCRDARPWLAEKGVRYTEVDIYSTPGAEEQVRKWNQGKLITPTFDIDGVTISDFDKLEIMNALKLD